LHAWSQFDFGGFSFSFGDEEAGQKEVKGDEVVVDVFVTLEDLYNGQELLVHREKATFQETAGTRECNCQQKVRDSRAPPPTAALRASTSHTGRSTSRLRASGVA